MVGAGVVEKGQSEESPTTGQILKGNLLLFPGETFPKKLLTGGLGKGLFPVPELWVLTLSPPVLFTGSATHAALALVFLPTPDTAECAGVMFQGKVYSFCQILQKG